MISYLFNTFLYNPLYNALVFLTDVIPGADVGLAVIALTIVVKVFILPLQHKQRKSQQRMQELQKEINDLRKKHKGDRQAESQALMALYQEHGINPFSGIAPMLIQLPILLALYWVFIQKIPFTIEGLYQFVSLPGVVNFSFLNLVDLTQRSITLAILVGITLYIQIRLSLPPIPPRKKGEEPNFGEDLARSMNMNMRYVMPLFLTFVSLGFPSVVSLYFVTSNIFMIGHELYVKREAKKLLATPTLED